MNIKNVLFVCTGNTCRSLMAEGLFKKELKEKDMEHINVCSAGIAACSSFQVPSAVVSLMNKEGIDISKHKPTQINYKLLNEADIILVMEDEHKKYILEHFANINKEDKIFLLKEFAGEKKNGLNINDPIGRSEAYYQFCFEEIKRCLKEIVQNIKKQ